MLLKQKLQEFVRFTGTFLNSILVVSPSIIFYCFPHLRYPLWSSHFCVLHRVSYTELCWVSMTSVLRVTYPFISNHAHANNAKHTVPAHRHWHILASQALQALVSAPRVIEMCQKPTEILILMCWPRCRNEPVMMSSGLWAGEPTYCTCQISNHTALMLCDTKIDWCLATEHSCVVTDSLN
jgi:hypothetical protein